MGVVGFLNALSTVGHMEADALVVSSNCRCFRANAFACLLLKVVTPFFIGSFTTRGPTDNGGDVDETLTGVAVFMIQTLR